MDINKKNKILGKIADINAALLSLDFDKEVLLIELDELRNGDPPRAIIKGFEYGRKKKNGTPKRRKRKNV